MSYIAQTLAEANEIKGTGFGAIGYGLAAIGPGIGVGIVAGKAIAKGFADVEVGHTLHFAGRDWTVVGIMDADRSAFDSELWADSHQAMQAFRRPAYSRAGLSAPHLADSARSSSPILARLHHRGARASDWRTAGRRLPLPWQNTTESGGPAARQHSVRGQVTPRL